MCCCNLLEYRYQGWQTVSNLLHELKHTHPVEFIAIITITTLNHGQATILIDQFEK